MSTAWKEATAHLALDGLRLRGPVVGFVSEQAPGLIIHPASMPMGASFGCWSVTHRTSGRSVLPFCPDREYAEHAAIELARGVNWKRPYRDIERDRDAKTLAHSFVMAFNAPIVRPER